jgi:hypothetical protein
MGSLYRTEALRSSHYNPNGEGRDTYIHVNNGGIERNAIPYKFKEQSRITRRSFSPGSPRLDPKPLKYKPDGTGRDTYIGVNHGGLFASDQKTTFYSSLRQPINSNFFNTQTVWLQNRRTKEIEYQKELCRRLSLPKDFNQYTAKK